MNLAEIVEFNKKLVTAQNMTNDGTLGLLQEAFSHLIEYALSIENQIDLDERILEFETKGWTRNEIIDEYKTINLYSLAQLLESTDKIGEITEKHIEIKKKSGTVHYYVKKPNNNQTR